MSGIVGVVGFFLLREALSDIDDVKTINSVDLANEQLSEKSCTAHERLHSIDYRGGCVCVSVWGLIRIKKI